MNWSRLRQRYTTLTYRREPVLVGLVFVGAVVEARNPQELATETELVLVERACNGMHRDSDVKPMH